MHANYDLNRKRAWQELFASVNGLADLGMAVTIIAVLIFPIMATISILKILWRAIFGARK